MFKTKLYLSRLVLVLSAIAYSLLYINSPQCLAGNLNKQYYVGCEDLDTFTDEWLNIGSALDFDLYEDELVNFYDYSLFVDSWLPQGRLASFWSGESNFVVNDFPVSGPPNMIFLSSFWNNDTLYACYIEVGENYLGEQSCFKVGTATSLTGYYFNGQGTALPLGGSWQWQYNAINDMSHIVGSIDGDGWSADPTDDETGFLCFGPHVTDIARGNNTVFFEMMVGNNYSDNDYVVNIEVYDATVDQIIANRQIRRTEFQNSQSYQKFPLEYTQIQGHLMEFRTWWYDTAYIKQRAVGVTQGVKRNGSFWDDRIASFPGIWKDGDTWYMVYEGAGTSSSWPGDIGLATSTDGVNWIKDPHNPILTHSSQGWESVNIGTPSLWKEGDTWYLFYHGFDGSDCQVGVAVGTDLHALTKYHSNPVVDTSNNKWDSGTIGKRSIIKEGQYYYMVYEGSTNPPYDQASWSSGIAISSDLVNWTKSQYNPVLPQTGTGFGYDGPEWVETSDGQLYIYFRGEGNVTYRAKLQ